MLGKILKFSKEYKEKTRDLPCRHILAVKAPPVQYMPEFQL